MDINLSLDYGLTLLAALLIGTGFVLQQNAAQVEPDSRFLSLRLILDLFHKPRWLVGIGCMVAGQALAAWSIGNLPLAFVEPLLTTNLVFALLVAVPIAKASLRFWEILGAVVLCCGVAERADAEQIDADLRAGVSNGRGGSARRLWLAARVGRWATSPCSAARVLTT